MSLLRRFLLSIGRVFPWGRILKVRAVLDCPVVNTRTISPQGNRFFEYPSVGDGRGVKSRFKRGPVVRKGWEPQDGPTVAGHGADVNKDQRFGWIPLHVAGILGDLCCYSSTAPMSMWGTGYGVRYCTCMTRPQAQLWSTMIHKKQVLGIQQGRETGQLGLRHAPSGSITSRICFLPSTSGGLTVEDWWNYLHSKEKGFKIHHTPPMNKPTNITYASLKLSMSRAPEPLQSTRAALKPQKPPQTWRAAGLQTVPQHLLGTGARVIITRNQWQGKGLVNATIGIVEDIIWQADANSSDLPIVVLVSCKSYKGPTLWRTEPRDGSPEVALTISVGSDHPQVTESYTAQNQIGTSAKRIFLWPTFVALSCVTSLNSLLFIERLDWDRVKKLDMNGLKLTKRACVHVMKALQSLAVTVTVTFPAEGCAFAAPKPLTRKIFCRILPASSTSVNQAVSTPGNPTSSESIGGAGDTTIGGLEIVLAMVNQASGLLEKIPFIAPVAGLLGQLLTMRSEVTQYGKKWDVVMEKVEQVAGIVPAVCMKYARAEEDLPSGLRDIFQSLQTDLGGIRDALNRSRDLGRVKKTLLRKDLQLEIDRYDGKLSNVLGTFQVCRQFAILIIRTTRRLQAMVVLDTGFKVEEMHKVDAPGPYFPQIFFGRDSERAEILRMIFSDLGSPARIAILGPGGYGKSTLANAVLTHKDVQEHFGDARYFVACESVFSSGALLTELAKTLGLLDGATASLWSRIETALDTKDCILCLDNFESPWDQDGDTKYSVEKLLSEITKLQHTTVLITMRGEVRPGQTSWTQPPLRSLKTLDHDAAKSIWKQIANSYDDYAEKLIEAVDCVPLAVTLLSSQSEAVSPELLLKQWNEEEHTEFIHMGQNNRHLNLNF
ncbi:hypothetical protein BJV74DRAFT_990545 [Russula compacta]|nr:hypothetical protein BJV74DRAFT_990545 [Russula compacta]